MIRRPQKTVYRQSSIKFIQPTRRIQQVGEKPLTGSNGFWWLVEKFGILFNNMGKIYKVRLKIWLTFSSLYVKK